MSGNRCSSRSLAPRKSSTTRSKSPEPISVPVAATASARGLGGAARPRRPRSHRRRVRSTPAAAAEAGSSRSAGSTQAASAPRRVTPAARVRQSPVRPEDVWPWTSETWPRRSPPPRAASIVARPVASGARRASPRSGGASACSRRTRSSSSRAALVAGAGRRAALMFRFFFANDVRRSRLCQTLEIVLGVASPGAPATPRPRRRLPGSTCGVRSGIVNRIHNSRPDPTSARASSTCRRTFWARRTWPAALGWRPSRKLRSGTPATPCSRNGTK